MIRGKSSKKLLNLDELSAGLEFNSTLAYTEWLMSYLCMPYFAEYKKDWVDLKGMRCRRGIEFDHVTERMAQGESSGRRQYSRDYPDKSEWDCVDHQARLLYQLHNANLLDVNGIFYDKELHTLDAYYRLWPVILRYNSKFMLSKYIPSQVMQTKEAVTSAQISPHGNIPQQIHLDGGSIRVLWENIPMDCEDDEGFSPLTVVNGVSSMNYESFIRAIGEKFGLTDKGLSVRTVIFDNDDISTFDEAAKHASRSLDSVLARVYTVKHQTTSLPDLGEKPDDFVQSFALMLAESQSDSMDIKERFWKWTVCRIVGLQKPLFQIGSRQLLKEALNAEDETLLVCPDTIDTLVLLC